MTLKELGEGLAKLGLPILGRVLPIPGGAAICDELASFIGASSGKPEDILAAISANSDAVAKARQFELQHEERMQAIISEADTKQMEAINKTLQADAAGPGWWQHNHHAFESSFVLLMVAVLYVIFPATGVPVPVVPESVWIMVMTILGVRAWHDGQAKVEGVKQGG